MSGITLGVKEEIIEGAAVVKFQSEKLDISPLVLQLRGQVGHQEKRNFSSN